MKRGAPLILLAAGGVLLSACNAPAQPPTALEGDAGRMPGETGPRPSEPGVGPVLGEACRQVDLLISVDPSGSMREEREAMGNDVFPAFARLLLDEVGGGLENFRVATIDSCPDPANFHARGAAGDCGFEDGRPWIESHGDDVPGQFRCVGDLYLDDLECSGSNDDEQPASAAATALSEPWISAHNSGFLREDALLVVVAITDEDERPVPAATLEEVYERLVAVKGDVRRMVFLGIGGGSDCEGVYGKAEEAKDLFTLTERFAASDRGVFWDLCAGRLEDGLEEALSVINSACGQLPSLF